MTKGDRSTTAAGFLIVRSPPSLPIIRLDGLPSGYRVSPSDRLVLGASVQSVAPDLLALRWTQTAGPPVDLTDPLVAATAVSSPSLVVLLPGALRQGASYVFTLNATDPAGTATAELPVSVARAPRGLRGAPVGSVAAAVQGGVGTTANGVAFVTVFSLSAAGWADEDGPLLYQFQYTMSSSSSSTGAGAAAADAAPPLPVILAPFQRADSLSGVSFPAGLESAERVITVQLCAITPGNHRNPAPPVFLFPC